MGWPNNGADGENEQVEVMERGLRLKVGSNNGWVQEEKEIRAVKGEAELLE